MFSVNFKYFQLCSLTSWLYYYCYCSPVKIEDDYSKEGNAPERITVCSTVLTNIMKQKYETTLLVFTYCISAPLLFYHIAILKPPIFFPVNICCQYPVHPLRGLDTKETHSEAGIAKIKLFFSPHMMDYSDVSGKTTHFVWHFFMSTVV